MSVPERDPDITPPEPSTSDRLERTELAFRTLRLRHQQQQTKLVEEANAMTRYPKEQQDS